MTYDRMMIEAAIRNGAPIEAGEAAAMLGTIDRLSAELRDARAEVRAASRRYVVTTVAGAGGLFELHIVDQDGAEVGVTQTEQLDQAEAVVRDYLGQTGHDAEAPVRVVDEMAR